MKGEIWRRSHLTDVSDTCFAIPLELFSLLQRQLFADKVTLTSARPWLYQETIAGIKPQIFQKLVLTLELNLLL